MRHEIQLPQGTIRYRDTGDAGPARPVVVLVHGLLVDSRLYDGVIEALGGDVRVVAPDLPLGSHRVALNAGADRTPGGIATLIADFLEALGLDDVTLVGNDTGGALCQIVVTTRPERIGRLVLTPCDTFDDFLPKLFRPLQWAARSPFVLRTVLQTQRLAVARRLTFSPLVKRPLPDELLRSWAMPSLEDAGVFEDVRAFTAAIDTRYTLEAAERVRSFDKPVLIAWAPGDRFFLYANAKRLADHIPDVRLEAVEGSRSFLPWDQPGRLADLIREFVRPPAPAPAAAAAPTPAAAPPAA